jgi:hypothetical protein
MSARFIIADVTSHRRGFGVQPIIDAAARRAQTAQQEVGMIWLVPSHLTAAFEAAHGQRPCSEVQVCDLIGPAVWKHIEREIDKIHATTPGAEILVITWDQMVYAAAQRHCKGVIGAKWFDSLLAVRTARVPIPLQAPEPAPPINSYAALPSLEQLRVAIVSYLKLNGAASQERAMYRSKLRPALVRATPGFHGIEHHPLFGMHFKAALDSAIGSKTIGQECPSPGRERIWVVEAVVPPVAPEDVATPPENDQLEAKAPIYRRTAEFRKRVTDLGIFCEKRDRDVLTEALNQILGEGKPQLSRLRRELPKRASKVANERGVCASTEFRRIANFFIKLLLLSEVLIGEDDKPIPRDVGCDAATVARLAEKADLLTETYLLEQILKKSDVEDHEHWQLAHVLFREFDTDSSIDDKLDRIAVLLRGLNNRIILSDSGTYEYTGIQQPASVRPIRAQA